MPIPGLIIIGESINDSVPSTKVLFDVGDIDGLIGLARAQDAKGASYIDVNVGARPPEFMADLVRTLQRATAKPLSIDTPDPSLAAAALEAYDPALAGGRDPILNSISPLRMEMFDLYRIRPFRPILMASERDEGGPCPNRTPEETHRTALRLLDEAKTRLAGFRSEWAIIDPGIAPIGSDCEGQLRRVLESLALLKADPALAGVHMSVGLSNFTVMLPSKRTDGSPVKGPLESAFLTLAMPKGLDTIIGSMSRKYEILPDGHPALTCLKDILGLEGYETLIRLREFYA
jgi:5-methyltetrahydrofolate--homocysteine methyltransferase